MIKIDPEFQTLIPPLTDDEYQRLEKSILAEGVRECIITWDGTIIDGHNRYRICKKHGLECPNIERTFKSRDAAKIWIIENQLGRRNLEAGQKAALVIDRDEARVREQARLRQVQAGIDFGGDKKSLAYRENRLETQRAQADFDSTKQHEPNREQGRTAEILAKQAGVGSATIKRVLKVKRENQELYDKVRSGEVSTTDAYAQVTGTKKQKATKKSSDTKRICTICGKPIEDGDAYKSRLFNHKKCFEEQRSKQPYKNPDILLLENVPVYNVKLLMVELMASAKDLRETWLTSIEINESMGVVLDSSVKSLLEEAADNLIDTVQTIMEEIENV